MSEEPTALPSRWTKLPFARQGKATCLMPQTTAG